MGQESGKLSFRGLVCCRVHHQDKQLRAELMENLPACATRRGRARRADRESLEFAFPFRDGRGQRNPLGTYGEAIGRVLNVAPGEDAACSRHQGCAHLEFRVRGVCSLPHIQRGFDPGPLFATVHSPPPSSRFPPSALLQLRGPCLPCRSSQPRKSGYLKNPAKWS